MNRFKTLAAATFALLFLAACGSSGNGIGDIFGNGSNRNATYDIRGTVDSVDTNNQSIYLTNISGYSTSLNTSGTSSVRVFYDSRTTLNYQGRTYRPDQLERGDEVTVRADQSGNQLIAQSMDVTHNSRGGMASSGGTYGAVVHGTVRSVDTYRRTISVDRGYGSNMTVEYNANTPVSFNGRSYSPADLRAGDEIDIRTNDLGNGRLSAQDITVTRTINGIGGIGSNSGSSSSSSSISTIRGTVRSVDAGNRTIEIENSSWISGFRTNTGTRFIIHYDSNTNVDYNGQLYPVTNLERGDVVEAQVQNLGSSNYLAQRVVLVRNVR